MVANILDGFNSISFRIMRCLNVGADVESIHDLLVSKENLCTEEEFFLAFQCAKIRYADLEAYRATRT